MEVDEYRAPKQTNTNARIARVTSVTLTAWHAPPREPQTASIGAALSLTPPHGAHVWPGAQLMPGMSSSIARRPERASNGLEVQRNLRRRPWLA